MRARAAALGGLTRRQFVFCLAVWATASFAIAVAHVQLMTPDGLRPFTDSQFYLAMARGQAAGIPAPWAYRVGVPSLAALIPLSLAAQLSGSSTIPSWAEAARFAVVSAAFLLLQGIVLFVLLRQLKFGQLEALLGTLLFYTARSTLQSGGMPTIEPAAWFCFTAVLVLALEARTLALVPAFAVGMFVKETLLLAVPLFLLTDLPLRRRLAQVAAALPGVGLYLATRYVLAPSTVDTTYSFGVNVSHPARIAATVVRHVTQPERWIELFSAFGFLWLPAVYAFGRGDGSPVLRRWSCLVPGLYGLIVVLSLDVGRILFIGHPIVLPFALLGMRRWFHGPDAVPVGAQAES